MTFFVLSIIGILCYLSEVLSIPPGTVNGCKQTDGTRFCCTGFYELNDTCQECVGSFGHNCVNPCPPGWFGPRCRKTCTCPDNKCDDVLGCVKDKLSSLSPTSNLSTDGSVMSNHANISTDVYVKVLITEKGLWGNLKTMGIQYWIILSSALFLFILTAFSIVIITCNRKTKQIQQNYHLIKEESNSVYAVPKEEKREGLFAGLMRDSVYAGHKLNNLTFSTHLKSDKQIGSEQVYMHLKHFNEEI